MGGGTSVTITGTNFLSGATVTFGATAATSVVVVSGTQITATTAVRCSGEQPGHAERESGDRADEWDGAAAIDGGDQGNSKTANSGAATTTMANELIFGAATVGTTMTGAGNGFTSRIITSPDGDNAKDRVVTKKGSYSATVPLKPSGAVMQIVTFK
jgi:hypothetical protein